MAFTLGTALSGAMGGFGQGLQNNAMMQALQEQQRKRQAQGLAFQALLAGALGNTGGLPSGGAPPVPGMGGGGMPGDGGGMPTPLMPPAQPPMPGQSSMPDGGLNTPVPTPPPVGAGGALPMRGGMGLDFAFDPRSSPYTGDRGAPLPGNESAIPPRKEEPDFIEPPAATTPAPAAPAPAKPADTEPPRGGEPATTPQTQAPFPQPERATHLDLSRFFHTVDPQQLAQAVMKAKPGVDPETAMMAVEQLYKLGTQGSKLEQAQTAYLLNYLHKEGALAETTRHHGATETTADQNVQLRRSGQAAVQERFQQREQRLGSQFAQRMAILERSQNPQIKAQAAALKARRQALLDQSNVASVADQRKLAPQIAAVDQQLEQLYTAEVKRMGGQVPATPMPMPAAPPQ